MTKPKPNLKRAVADMLHAKQTTELEGQMGKIFIPEHLAENTDASLAFEPNPILRKIGDRLIADGAITSEP